MVNETIVSQFEGDLPRDGASRKIAGGPLYSADEVLVLLAESGAQVVLAWTRKCVIDLPKWALDTNDVHELLEIALRSGRFRGSEWCKHSPNGPWAACDAYSLARRERMPYGRTQMDVEYYVKFAVAKTGKLLIVSCHPPEERR